MLFIELAKCMEDIEKTRSRLEMTEIISNLFKKTSSNEIDKIIYLLQGKIAPEHKGIKLGLGERFVEQALAKSMGYELSVVQKKFSEKGDLGDVAEELSNNKKQMSLFSEELTLDKVYSNFYKLAEKSGHGSQDIKINILTEMLNNAKPIETRYISRFPIGSLRLGIGDPTILDALSNMKKGDKTDREMLEKAYNVCSDLGELARKYMETKNENFEIKMKIFTPLRPALAERLTSGEEILTKIEDCIVEAKYDGFRLQCHKKGNEIEIFSRKLERMTEMLPDVIESIKNEIDVDEIIFEGEAIGYNEKEKKFYSFQQTMQRKRKYEIDKKSEEIPLKLFMFDVMFYKGKDVTSLPLKERKKIMEKIIKKNKNVQMSEGYYIKTPEQIEEKFNEFINRGLEGLMAKDLNSPYIAGARKFSWIKLKKSYKTELSDTIDITIIGYYSGKGTRTKFNFGGILGGVYDSESDMFYSIAKVGTGFSEEQMKEFGEKLDKITLKNKHSRVDSEIEPTFWVEPKYVITVTADEISKSPIHTCGKFDGETGYALRFPRIIGGIRDDKNPEDSTTVDEIIKMYKLQKNN
jgi:DNA ligase-1